MKRALLWLITLVLATLAIGGWLTLIDNSTSDTAPELLIDFGIPLLLTIGAIRVGKAAVRHAPERSPKPVDRGRPWERNGPTGE